MDSLTPRIFRVQQAQAESPQVITLQVVADDGEPLRFKPGQFSMLYAFGYGEVPISMSGDPSQEEVLRFTVRDVGALTHKICSLRKGDWLGVRGPFGNPWPVESAQGKEVLVIAGGLGLAPLRSAIYSLIQNSSQYEKITLLYGSRSPDDMLFQEELQHWSKDKVLPIFTTVDVAPAGYTGKVGVVTSILSQAIASPQETVALVCGPEIMMRLTAQQLLEFGVAESSIFISMERNMKCAVGFCGHCQFGAAFICKDGPVMCYETLKPLLEIREL